MPSSMHVTQLSSFFNQLVELIPVKYYRSEDDSAPRINLQTLNKEQRLAAKQELKAKSKLNKKSKLSGDVSGEAAQQPPSSATAASETQQTPLLNIPAEHVSRTELQQRLHQRLQAMQQQRKGSEKAQKQEGVNKRQAAKQAKDWKQKTLESNVKAKQQQEQQQKQQQKQTSGSKRKADGESQPSEPAAKKATQQPQEPAANFAFPRIEMDSEGRHGNKAKKPSKEVLLKIAEAKQREVAAAAGTKPKVTQETWKAAMLRASGEKVLDDPKLLRKSLKKEVKRKEKSAKGWEERKQQQQEQQQARQSKRKENLQARTQGRQDKKKARREKKLLKAGSTGGGGADAAKKVPRAGFEGRRSSFIGDKGSKGGK